MALLAGKTWKFLVSDTPGEVISTCVHQRTSTFEEQMCVFSERNFVACGVLFSVRALPAVAVETRGPAFTFPG